MSYQTGNCGEPAEPKNLRKNRKREKGRFVLETRYKADHWLASFCKHSSKATQWTEWGRHKTFELADYEREKHERKYSFMEARVVDTEAPSDE